MSVLIDISVLIHAEREGKDLSSYVKSREEENAFLSAVSASELLLGAGLAATPKARARRLAFAEGVIDSIPVIEIDLPTARAHAQLLSELLKGGIKMNAGDSWLAAACLAHGLHLATAEPRDFRRVPGLIVEEWK